jgi:hypothetical protein
MRRADWVREKSRRAVIKRTTTRNLSRAGYPLFCEDDRMGDHIINVRTISDYNMTGMVAGGFEDSFWTNVFHHCRDSLERRPRARAAK